MGGPSEGVGPEEAMRRLEEIESGRHDNDQSSEEEDEAEKPLGVDEGRPEVTDDKQDGKEKASPEAGGAQNDKEKAAKEKQDGLARCIRSEITGINFLILHLSESTGKEHGPALAASIATRDTQDNEFREVQGVLQATYPGTVFPDLEGHERVVGLLQASERIVSLLEQHAPLKLIIVRPGLLDTLCIITDEDIAVSKTTY
ncbi:hypothetical protein DHEL01_v207536 [Diaporthe helianthi]|uniref:Uncharacterized protein n=1 Tax=Diaporthe helianthi TaxID=158607 RepID=A0A2P5HV00_DIAHE|nr:hypothetical protein DHEL01_v207536 [Diaporthe helianthi]